MSPDPQLSEIVKSTDSGGCLIRCQIQPRSSRSGICGILGDSLKIALNSPPVDGKANGELIKYLSKFLGISKSMLVIRSGELSRHKVIEVKSLDAVAVAAKISLVLTPIENKIE